MANPYILERSQNPHLLRRRPFGAYPEDSPSHPVRPRTDTQFPRSMPPPQPEVIKEERAQAPKGADAPAFDPIKTALEAYQAKVPTTTKGKILEALKTAGLGALQAAAQDRENPLGAAIGGAAAGGAISAISPRTGRAFQFETIIRPRMEADIAGARKEEERQRANRIAAMDEARKRGEVDQLPIRAEQERAQTEQMRAQTQIARQNAAQQQALTESQIKLNEARTEAAKTGAPRIVDIRNPETGAIETVMVFPGGAAQVVGQSGRAAMNLQTNQSRERIVGQKLKAAQQKPQGGGKGWTTRADAKALLMRRGYSDADAERELDRLGIK